MLGIKKKLSLCAHQKLQLVKGHTFVIKKPQEDMIRIQSITESKHAE